MMSPQYPTLSAASTASFIGGRNTSTAISSTYLANVTSTQFPLGTFPISTSLDTNPGRAPLGVLPVRTGNGTYGCRRLTSADGIGFRNRGCHNRIGKFPKHLSDMTTLHPQPSLRPCRTATIEAYLWRRNLNRRRTQSSTAKHRK